MNGPLGWQDCLVAAALAWAVWHLARRAVGVVCRDTVTGCGTCRGCDRDPMRIDTEEVGFVSSDSLHR